MLLFLIDATRQPDLRVGYEKYLQATTHIDLDHRSIMIVMIIDLDQRFSIWLMIIVSPA